jgi:hypothetical protein
LSDLDHERIILLTVGALLTATGVLFYRYGTVQEYLAFVGQPALAATVRRIGSGYAQFLAPFCVFLTLVVLRPSPIRRYYQVMFAVWVLTIITVSVLYDEMHPRPRSVPEQTGPSPFTPSHKSGAPEGTVEKWAEITQNFPMAWNAENTDYNADRRATGLPQELRIGDMLADPDKAADQLKRTHRVIRRHRAAFAKIVAEAQAGLEAEQAKTKSPLLQSYEDQYSKRGANMDRELALFDRTVMEFDAMLNDLTHSKGKVEVRGDKIHFSEPEDREAYERHGDRLDQIDRDRAAFRKSLGLKPK